MKHLHLALAAGVLLVYGAALPVELPRSATASTAECERLADAPTHEPRSIGLLERCVELLPRDAELLADLGAEYEAVGRPANAEAVYRRALAVDPQHAEVRRRLAVRLFRRGAMDDARREAVAALSVQPNRKALLDLLAEIGSEQQP